jgi:hypothetical protein
MALPDDTQKLDIAYRGGPVETTYNTSTGPNNVNTGNLDIPYRGGPFDWIYAVTSTVTTQSTTGILTTLEKPASSTTGILTTLEKPAGSTVAVNATLETPAVGSLLVKTGTYTGTGSALSVTDVGFQPELVIVKALSSTAQAQFKTTTMSGSNSGSPGFPGVGTKCRRVAETAA